MNIFNSIFKAFKDGATQMGEPVVDQSDIHSFEASIAQASLQLAKAKRSQKEIAVQLAQKEALVKHAQSSISNKEQQAINASESGDENAALAIAGDIVTQLNTLKPEQELLNYLRENIAKIDKETASLTREINEMKAQLSQVKATDAVHQVQTDLSSQHAQLPSAKDSLAKLKAKQAETQANVEVAQEVNDFLSDSNKSLDEKLATAKGTKEPKPEHAASQVLEALKAKQKE